LTKKYLWSSSSPTPSVTTRQFASHNEIDEQMFVSRRVFDATVTDLNESVENAFAEGRPNH
jgi:hypothetical protein